MFEFESKFRMLNSKQTGLILFITMEVQDYHILLLDHYDSLLN